MTPSPQSPRSRWVHPSVSYSIAAFLSGIAVVPLRLMVGPWASILGALIALPLSFWVINRSTLYPHVYRGRSLAMAGFLISFLGLSDAVGRVAYQELWERAFRLDGQGTLFENSAEGWRIQYPKHWIAYSMKEGGVTTYFFKPDKATPTLEFALMRRSEEEGDDLETSVNKFLLALPKSGATQIISQGPIRYPLFQRAHEVIYEDPTQLIVLRHRLIFLSNAEGLTILSVAAVPAWFERLSEEIERFLFSFEPIG